MIPTMGQILFLLGIVLAHVIFVVTDIYQCLSTGAWEGLVSHLTFINENIIRQNRHFTNYFKG